MYFEKEDTNTLDSKGEFLITLLSSLAEEESRSISENGKWCLRKRFADGKYTLPYKQFLGYKKGPDGAPELIAEEAKIIQTIYRLYLEGYSTTAIAKKLTEAGIPTPANHAAWQRATIESILRNEKYYGAALMQKRYCVDFRTKQMVPNRGELPMYYVENGHEAIISKEIFVEVQKRLSQNPPGFSTTLPFSHKLFCADCGGLFGPIPIHSTTYNDIVWKCSNRHLHKFPCTVPYLYEEMLKDIFLKIILMILKQNPGIIRRCKTALKAAGITPAAFNEKIIMDTIATYDVNSATEQQIWRTIIQKVVVHPELLLEFHLLDGSVIPFQTIKTAPRAGRLTQGAKRAAIEAYRQGKNASEIAHEFDMSVRTIQNLIRYAQMLRIQPINSK